ncbi:MAG: formate dehydrogenase, partial [Candidatus Lokiarchaeota archaeon]|nr:formate dehydrogenase [Candidatus Lokiarchaeota archaeon]MBD3201668.1 formate dehydrogenase [Candidatus Lokiarchaeota archaeon]
YTHSQFQNVYGKIPPIVYINPEDALRENIEENQIVTLFNNLGSIALKVKTRNVVPHGNLLVAKLVNGINGNPINSLTSCEKQQIGNGPIFNSTIVKIRKLQKDE